MYASSAKSNASGTYGDMTVFQSGPHWTVNVDFLSFLSRDDACIRGFEIAKKHLNRT